MKSDMKRRLSLGILVALCFAGALSAAYADGLAQNRHRPPPDELAIGADPIEVDAFRLPPSGLLDRESLTELKSWAKFWRVTDEKCPEFVLTTLTPENILSFRSCLDRNFFPPLLDKYNRRFRVTIEKKVIAGVPTEIIAPSDGISEANRDRVLINLHGGGFIVMAGGMGRVESIPIAAMGKIKVVSINYRMAPEFHFPAASEDVAAVYKALLSTYQAKNIGIYGCSAGGVLTGQSVAWLQKEKLPLPGAVGIFSAGVLSSRAPDDSGNFTSAILGMPAQVTVSVPYVRAADYSDPLAFPGLRAEYLAKFPPSLLISGTRDHQMSQIIATHARLVHEGVKADLHIWEGMGHCFSIDPDQKEAGEAYDVITRFFAANLGR